MKNSINLIYDNDVNLISWFERREKKILIYEFLAFDFDDQMVQLWLDKKCCFCWKKSVWVCLEDITNTEDIVDYWCKYWRFL